MLVLEPSATQLETKPRFIHTHADPSFGTLSDQAVEGVGTVSLVPGKEGPLSLLFAQLQQLI